MWRRQQWERRMYRPTQWMHQRQFSMSRRRLCQVFALSHSIFGGLIGICFYLNRKSGRFVRWSAFMSGWLRWRYELDLHSRRSALPGKWSALSTPVRCHGHQPFLCLQGRLPQGQRWPFLHRCGRMSNWQSQQWIGLFAHLVHCNKWKHPAKHPSLFTTLCQLCAWIPVLLCQWLSPRGR